MGRVVFRGRRDELTTIKNVIESAIAGSGASLLVTGPPGAGRSTLLTEAAATTAGVEVMTARGVATESAMPYSGLSELLAPVMAEIEQLPAPQAHALRCAVGLADGPAPASAVGMAVLEALTHIAARGPLLLVVDDLHLLDEASGTALLFAVRRLRGRPVAALLSAESPLDQHVAGVDLPQLALTELDEEAAGELLADNGWTPPVPLQRAALAVTGGNPLALVELAAARSPAERLEDIAGRIAVPLAPRQHAAFLRQVAPLPPETRRLLVLAAAAVDVPTGAVYEAAGRLGLGIEALGPAERAGVVTVRPAQIQFRHPLLRAAVYLDAPHLRRLAAHDALAAAVDTLDADAAIRHRALATRGTDETLAEALEQIALRRPASYSEVAVMLSAARLSESAHDRQRRTVAAALAAWGSGQADLARDLAGTLPTVTGTPVRARLAWLHGLLEIGGGDPVGAYTRLERAADELAAAVPVEAALLLVLGIAAAYDAGELASGQRAAATIARMGGPIRQIGEQLGLALDGRLPTAGSEPSRVLAEMPVEIGRHPGLREAVVMAIGALGPHPVLAREFGVSLCEAQRTTGMLGTLAMNLLWLADVNIHLGHLDDAAACAEEVLRLRRDTCRGSSSASALAHLSRVAAVRGDRVRCQELASAALAIAVPARARAAAAQATWAAGLSALAEGDFHEACDRLVLLTGPGTPFSHELIARLATPDLVEAAVRAERFDLARRVTSEFADWARHSTLPWARAHLHRCLALVADDDDEAHRHFALAGEAAAADTRPFELARVALLRGEALRRDRRRAEARTPLRLAVELFDGQGARRWAEIARSQLRGAGGLGTTPRDDRAVSAVLTTQELQVARLAAGGLSNKEIAAALFLSPRTVGYHLYKMFPKLGISTRSQLRNIDLDDIATPDDAATGTGGV